MNFDMKMRKAPMLCTSVLLMLAGSLPAFDLVKDGKTAEIVLPEKPHTSTKLAAQELTEYTEKVTGKKLRIDILAAAVTARQDIDNRL